VLNVVAHPVGSSYNDYGGPSAPPQESIYTQNNSSILPQRYPPINPMYIE
jgi:hypothetical protein